MLSRRLYYALKPYVPWHIRMGVRRVLARRQREQFESLWPIDASAGTPPSGWPGWPDGKKFALLLTHDVEGPEGLAKCRQLAELEIKLGFRSCFNFIPEGSYRVPDELRAWLTSEGFEVGVHDLHHDGKLFLFRKHFAEKALRINQYLKKWGAAGFRSGFMLRNLDWIHELNVSYDSSTFDTDPFEPQSDGTGTIFPFWIATPPSQSGAHGDSPDSLPTAASRGGYLEIPYTLPQDSTLFLLLREKNPSIWIKKLDWIAGLGGMATVNVHPDYMAFQGRCSSKEFPASAYAELLEHVRARYTGQFWNPQPRELAERYVDFCQQHPRHSHSTAPMAVSAQAPTRRAAVLLYSNYPFDPRPRRAAEAMVESGMAVDLHCLANSSGADAPHQIVGGVKVSRIRLTHRRDSKLAYIWQYGRFLWSSFWFMTWNGLRRKYDVVHVHNMPDFLVFAAIVPKLRGAKVILDLHDPMPELMMSIYGLKPGHIVVRLLRLSERWSIRFANLVLTPNLSFKKLFVARGCPPDKVQIVMNSPEESIFTPAQVPAGVTPRPVAEEFRVMHHGSILHRHGVDQLVEAIAKLQPVIPGIRLDIYGKFDPFLEVVLNRAKELNISSLVHYHGPKSQKEIARAIQECHVGVVPNRRSTFTETNFPTRLFEYLAMERPVIAPSTQGNRDYFNDRQILFFEPGDVDDLAARLRWVREHPAESREIVRAGREIYQQHLWSHEKARFVDLVGELSGRT